MGISMLNPDNINCIDIIKKEEMKT